MQYLLTFKTSFMVFPFIALLITLPYILIEYHKYGSINKLRTLIIYSFILYMITIYFLIILPLPTRSEVDSLTTPRVQLKLLNFIEDIKNYNPFIITDPSTYLKSLFHPSIYVNLFNIFMFIPFGMYLRYYFKKSKVQVIIYSFLLSLFFELTQLTGLYFIYSRSYRLFDVDDLLLNTIGGLIGYFIMGLVKFLPTRDEIDKSSLENGKKVSGLRRVVLFFLDIFIYLIICLIVYGFYPKAYIKYIIFVLYFGLIPTLTNGVTLGSKYLKVKFECKNLKFIRYLLKEIVCALYYYKLPIYIIKTIFLIQTKYINNVNINLFIDVFIIIMLFIVYFITLIHILKTSKIFYDKISNVEFASLIE